jgi:hypothetical protein
MAGDMCYSLYQMLAKFLFDSDPSSTAFCTDAEHDILSQREMSYPMAI